MGAPASLKREETRQTAPARKRISGAPTPPRGPGRPVTVGARHITVTLDDATVERARAIGGGNVSSGLRIAVARVTRRSKMAG